MSNYKPLSEKRRDMITGKGAIFLIFASMSDKRPENLDRDSLEYQEWSKRQTDRLKKEIQTFADGVIAEFVAEQDGIPESEDADAYYKNLVSEQESRATVDQVEQYLTGHPGLPSEWSWPKRVE